MEGRSERRRVCAGGIWVGTGLCRGRVMKANAKAKAKARSFVEGELECERLQEKRKEEKKNGGLRTSVRIAEMRGRAVAVPVAEGGKGGKGML